ncbi:serpin family protein [Haloferax mediterranei ATCC 33500]|uniref:Serine protease n=1 Tax=Haloferax mediterranei (strain ATCC 33500 / DSM 1411 / JCM 8866 / NBRC 14739 / NCIMB 2177 / R-4) TaxID=523841 RepID=I3R703_HALMT|nr:serpin family protein [Haloferax mediterranei]AFK20013.1 serine protease inhibitor family protein [Haloferax mediterranei ATCC 33500]AHZ23391.1 serine protease [Haloferax mediterranei ATCC 33500]ELZ99560.1 serine protease inhibitor family protein [Haloferax mediterranei ATCC 33500]MDX5987235.1 serpin family protein [Haloferax mediterranei ATCC 33500]QCQ73757.1 serpin family protein [Haloferax mediterranei ATCC 33500]
MNRREILALSGALAAASLAGCAGGDGSQTETETDETPSTDTPTETPTETPDGEPPTGEPTVDNEQLAALAAGNAEFALDLHSHLAAKDGGNQFLSPYSISVALAMTYAGARGETRTQMEETLRYTLGDEVHPAFSDLQAALESRETAKNRVEDEEVDAFQLAVANALWGQEGYPFSDEYLSVLEENYGSGLREADFTNDPDGERKRINQWVADQTEDRIEDLLPADAITPQTVLVLTNAIYFMASWLHKFDPKNTEDGIFTALDGTESTVPLMQQELEANYADLPTAQAVELPYIGEEVSMVLMLPDEGEFESFEQNLDTSRLFGIFQELSRAQGTLVFPRFEFETEVQLSDALSELGMPIAFGSGADFSGMVEGDQSGLMIDEVYHKTFVSVDEEGTEAAASTAVVMMESLPPQWDELRFDRPFLFCIRDKPTDAVLFYGRVVDAGAAQDEN